MSEERRVFRNTFVLALSSLIERVSSLFLVFVISRTFHASGLGVYAAALAFFGLLALVAEGGTTNFLVREIAKDKSKTGRYVLHLSVMATFLGFLVMALAAIAIPYLGYSAELRTGVYLGLLAIIPNTLIFIHEGVFVAHQRVEFNTYTTLTVTVLSLATNLYLLAHGYGIIAVIVTFVLTKYIVAICYLTLTTRYIASLHGRLEFQFVKTLLYELRPFAASSSLAGFFARPELILLPLFTDETQTGFYSAALRLVELWMIFPETYLVNVFPVLARAYHLTDHTAQLIQDRAIKYLLAVCLPLAVGLTVAAEPIVHLFYGPGFTGTVVILRILACGLPFFFLNALLYRILVARGQQHLNVRTQAITACSRLVGGCGLIAAFGPIGAAVTTISNVLLHNGLLSFYIRQAGTRVRPLRLVWRFILIALVMGAVVALIKDRFPLGILVPFAALVYVGLVLWIKAFSPGELMVFREMWQGENQRNKLIAQGAKNGHTGSVKYATAHKIEIPMNRSIISESPLVSILITNYNYARFLREAIESALHQTYSYVEVIVVDDGSTDDSRGIIASYGDRIIPVLKENGGMTSAVNAGYKASHGEIVCLLDADDVSLPEKVSLVLRAWKTNPQACVVYHQLQMVDEQKRNIGNPWPRAVWCEDIGSRVKRCGGWWPHPTTSGLCFSRTFLEQALPIPTKPYTVWPDTHLAGPATFLGPVIGVPTPLALFRLHGGNNWTVGNIQTKQVMQRRLSQCIVEFETLKETLSERFGLSPSILLEDHLRYMQYSRAAGELITLPQVILTALKCSTLPFSMKWREIVKIILHRF